MSTQKCLSDAELGRLLDGEVTQQEKQTLQQHIQTCPDCQKRWQRMSAGAQRVKQLFSKVASRIPATDQCPSMALLVGYIKQELAPEQRQEFEEHLTLCSNCRNALADKFLDDYMADGESWWPEYVGRQILSLLVKLPQEEIDSVLDVLKITPATPMLTEVTVKLPMLEPAEFESRRLAAATGDGLYEQTLHQDEPPFDFHIVQFGKQLRISVKAAGPDHSFENCLGRLQFFEKEMCKYSELLLVEKGTANCILAPDLAATLRPEIEYIKIRFTPMVTLSELTEAGAEAYRPILARLLQHDDSTIREDAAKVAWRIFGLKARPLLEPLLNDKDATVRQTVEEILQQLPPGAS